MQWWGFKGRDWAVGDISFSLKNISSFYYFNFILRRNANLSYVTCVEPDEALHFAESHLERTVCLCPITGRWVFTGKGKDQPLRSRS